MRDDIILIPHLYDINWSVQLNNLLSKHFLMPFYFKEDSYMPSKSLKNEYLAKILPYLRSNNVKKILFVNYLEDFSMDYIKSTPVKKIYGITHGSNFIPTEMGCSKVLQDYEVAISNISTKLFVATEFLQKILPYKTIVTGLPIVCDLNEPSKSNKILFNHRIMKEKNPMKLFELSDDIKQRIVISSPKTQTNYWGALKKEFTNMYFQPSNAEYRYLLSSCGFGVSFSDHDTFGYAVVEGILSGLLYFVPDNETTSYRELVIDELRYRTIEELENKIRYFTENYEERKKLVNKSRENLMKYYFENWVSDFIKNFD